jgi:hypothetical protein
MYWKMGHAAYPKMMEYHEQRGGFFSCVPNVRHAHAREALFFTWMKLPWQLEDQGPNISEERGGLLF